jgi:hypothetical protein
MAKIREIVTELAGYYAEPSRINKAVEAIKQELKEKMPKEKIHQGRTNNSRFNKKVDGYNQLLSEVNRIIEEKL